LVASVIQLIETTAKVVGYVNEVIDGPREGAELSCHASSLLSLLIELRYRVEDVNSESGPCFSSLRGLGAADGPLVQLICHMEQLASKLERPKRRLETLKKALKRTLDKKEIEEALGQIERVKTLVMLALQSD